ncbi:3-phosphoserine/phosphohydroxythreonine transaminase [Paenibacillus psychroresistens]|uniref:Phosphoserine aminotransferase n=1 Tax=Paenibacillus psychroresistens TaxID=1778678 RepID=A0A6B8RIB4_9BACL|nr:3-phosphoserine/phosphohydroxythreonine transaminase [Paenibacillus psychroresistens]QGQ95273.1 3-phosphoserine/phosphohydroxythreonine transaminase [Paenibacillus psychroresistens]
MTKRSYNFNAGPAALPLEVLKQAQEQFVDYNGIGMSIMEVSHRSKEYEQINDETQQLMSELLGLPAGYKVLFITGGASTQFTMIPMNLLTAGKTGSYIMTGAWAEKAYQEAQLVGEVSISASSREGGLLNMPAIADIKAPSNSAYVHITSNETISGTQFNDFPNTGEIPLIADMSSDILSRQIDASKFAMIYAGAQKNLGPSGVTVVIVREDLLKNEPKNLPTMLRYSTHLKNNSLYNTPPVYSVYMVNLVLKWIKANGGLAGIEAKNREKTALIYNTIDNSNGFYEGMVEKADRSLMNITFKLQSEELEKQFLKEAAASSFVGLAGHRSIGHLRASTYNAVPYESCKALAEFMQQFQSKLS